MSTLLDVMPNNLCILGRPGSGKSAAAVYLESQIGSVHIDDYMILHNWAYGNTDLKYNFIQTENNGFLVKNPRVYNLALQEAEKIAQEHISNGKFVTIEFARTNNGVAIENFSEGFRKNSAVLYLYSASFECIERIKNRVTHPKTIYDHPAFTEDEWIARYGTDLIYTITGDYEALRERGLAEENIHIFHNHGISPTSLAYFNNRLDGVINELFPSIAREREWGSPNKEGERF